MSDDYQDKADTVDTEKLREFAESLRDKNHSYFSIEGAVTEITEAQGVAKTALASSKLVGKVGFNIGKFAVTTILPFVLEEKTKQYDEYMKKQKT